MGQTANETALRGRTAARLGQAEPHTAGAAATRSAIAAIAGGNSTLACGAALGLAIVVIAGCIAIAVVVFGRRDVIS